MTDITLYAGDNRISLKLLPDNSISSVAADTPYALESIVRRNGKVDAAPVKHGKDGAFARASRRFVGKTWDVTGIERDPDFWREVLRVLKPGGYLAAFSGTRSYHRMTSAIEEAGFTIHPMIVWLNAQGLPKPHPVDKAIRRHLGPDAQEADEWEGWSYGGQVRSPAIEPICIAQKPFSEKNGAANILKWGTGGVNVSACRTEEGRHPSNIIHDGSPEALSLMPEGAGAFYESYPVIYHPKANAADRAGSNHSTVKPIGLMQAIVRHITPPGGVVLDPFAGSGTTGEAARREGFDCILMEAEPEYVDFLRKRFNLPDLDILGDLL